MEETMEKVAEEVTPVTEGPKFGTVFLKDWIQWVDGQSYNSVMGVISAHPNQEIAGFNATNKEANFCLKVCSKDMAVRGVTIVILGCQIRAVAMHDQFYCYPYGRGVLALS